MYRKKSYEGNSKEMMTLESSGAFSRCKATIHYMSKGTIFSSIFNLLTTSIGAGTLALPYAYSQGGLVFSSAVFLCIMLMSIVVGLYLYEAKRVCQDICPNMVVSGYEDLAEVAFGAIGRLMVLIILIILLVLTLVAYMIYTRDQLDFIIQFIYHQTGHVPDCSLLTNCAIIMCIGFVPLFPILLLKKMSLLQFTSTISIICVTFVTIMISIKTGLYLKQQNTTITIETTVDDSSIDIIGLFPLTAKGAITCISYCSLTFLCHFQLFSLEKELYRPMKWKLNFIVVSSMLIAYGLYNVVAISGYLRFGGETPEDIMTGYPNDNTLVTTLRIALFFTLLFSYPVLFHPTRDAINRLISYSIELYRARGSSSTNEGVGFIQDGDQVDERSELLSTTNIYMRFRKYNEKMMHRKEVKLNWLVWFCETWCLFAITFLPAAFIPNVGYVWNFVGSIGGSLVLYILPSLLYLRLRYFLKLKMAAERGTTLTQQYLQCSTWKELIGVLILITGIFVLVAGNYEAIDSIVQRSHDSTGSRCTSLWCVHMNATNDIY